MRRRPIGFTKWGTRRSIRPARLLMPAASCSKTPPTHGRILRWAKRSPPLTEGAFDLDDYIDYLISIMHLLGGEVHVVAVCQPSVPVLAAVARMEAEDDPRVPLSMVLMGGPIDPRVNTTAVNRLAEQ